MDPNACLALIEEATEESEAMEHVANLRDWLASGGFEPNWKDYHKGTGRYRMLLGLVDDEE